MSSSTRNPGEAAQIYIKTTSEKRSTQEEMAKFISDPDNIWTTTPQQTMTFAGFMHKVGTMKRLPNSWKDLYMPDCHDLRAADNRYKVLTLTAVGRPANENLCARFVLSERR